jgi:hypothetical protein
MKSRKLLISKDLGMTKEKISLLGDFIVFCCDELPISGDFCVKVVSDRGVNNIQTTAAYHMGKNDIRVYGKNRALVDIMRSIAHEMTHMLQDHRGMITGAVRDAGGFHEDHANSRAGELIKLYAKMPGRRAIYESINS